MGFFVRIYMRVCKKMVIYLGIKTPQSRKERKYTWQKNARICVAGMIASIRGKKPHVHGVIILKQMADHRNALCILRGSLPKSFPLDFGLYKTFALYFCHQYYCPS